MRTATYVVQLKSAEKQALEAMLKKRRQSARVLLLADAGKSTKEIQAATGMSAQGILNVKKRYCAEGLKTAMPESKASLGVSRQKTRGESPSALCK